MAGMRSLADAIAELPISTDSNELTGFPNKTDATRLFVDATRTFSLTPVATDYNWFESNLEYISTGQSIVISDVTGVHIIYENDGSLAEMVNPNTHEITVGIETKALVAILYWNAVVGEALYVGEERHRFMNGATHSMIHWTEGCQWVSGLGLTDMTVDGSGVDADAQVGSASGTNVDEDLYFHISAIAKTVGFPIFYMTGSEASPVWNRTVNAGWCVRTVDNTSATYLAYNENNAGTWQLSTPGNRDFMLMHIFATTDPDQPIIAIMGQSDYNNKSDAQDAALVEITQISIDRTLSPEILALGTIICQTRTTYANAVNTLFVSTDDGDDYMDWRGVTINHRAR